jgi:hypothetical protein
MREVQVAQSFVVSGETDAVLDSKALLALTTDSLAQEPPIKAQQTLAASGGVVPKAPGGTYHAN